MKKISYQLGTAVRKENYLNVDTHRVQLNAQANYMDVSAISKTTAGVRFAALKLKDTNQVGKIGLRNPYYDTVCFPLLYCGGEKGWQHEMKLGLMEYCCMRMLQPEHDSRVNNYYGMWKWVRVRGSKQLEHKFITSNRFQINAILSQHFLVDQESRSIDLKMEYIEAKQKEFKGYGFTNNNANNDYRNSDDDSDADGDFGDSSEQRCNLFCGFIY